MYECKLIVIKDSSIYLFEGLPVRTNEPQRLKLTVLEHNLINESLFVKTASKLTVGTIFTFEYSGAWILKKLRSRIRSLEIEKLIIFPFLRDYSSDNNRVNIAPVGLDNLENEKLKSLNESQRNAVNNCLNQKISLIWGPPGTGKSSTLSQLLRLFLSKKEKTLVCSIANVAVDGLILKLAGDIDEHEASEYLEKGKILRLGSVVNPDILAIDGLFYHRKALEDIRKEINSIAEEIISCENMEKRINLKAKNDELKNALQERQKEEYAKGLLYFSTAAFTLFEDLSQLTFDNIVIDEVSMMNIPYIFWLSSFARKRVIVAGDFRQLGPIALSNSRASINWMKRDIFNLISTDYSFGMNGPVSILDVQYRMNEKLCNQLSDLFYEGRLSTSHRPHQDTFSQFLSRAPIMYVKTPVDSKTYFSESRSRYNPKNLEIVKRIIDRLIAQNDSNLPMKIGIISPYREQTLKYKEIFAEPNFPQHIDISIGTIHTFQGSESDIIIFDLVDTYVDSGNKQNEISALFYGQDGERLINVGISRAKSKLILVGDVRPIVESSTLLTTPKFKTILNNLSRFPALENFC